MKRVSISIFMIVLFCLVMTEAVHAQGPVPVQIPNYINYQGKLLRYPRNPGREPIPANGTHTMTFRIYDAEDAPIDSPLWEETHVEVNVGIGIFNVLLGEVNPLYLRFEQDYWLGLEVYPDYEMQPRQRIVSTGYSFMSQDSYSLNGYVSGEGNGLNADMVDGRHYSDMANEITSHSNSKTTHGISGQIVGTTDDQVLTNKHISGEQIDSGTIDDARIPDDITINEAKGMRALSSAPTPESVGEVYFDIEDKMAYIWDGYQWNEYRGPQGIQGPEGKQGLKGNTGPQGPQGPSGPNNFAPSGRMRFCVFINHPPDRPNAIVAINWPLDWSIDACRKYVCAARWERWEVNDMYSNGSGSRCINGGCGSCP